MWPFSTPGALGQSCSMGELLRLHKRPLHPRRPCASVWRAAMAAEEVLGASQVTCACRGVRRWREVMLEQLAPAKPKADLRAAGQSGLPRVARAKEVRSASTVAVR